MSHIDPSKSSSTSPPTEGQQPLLLKLADAAPLAGLTTWQLRTLISNGELPYVRVGKRLFIRPESLTRWAKRAERGVR
jgi:hypothetical protein